MPAVANYQETQRCKETPTDHLMKNFEDHYHKQKHCMSSKHKHMYITSSWDPNVFSSVVVLKKNCFPLRGKNPTPTPYFHQDMWRTHLMAASYRNDSRSLSQESCTPYQGFLLPLVYRSITYHFANSSTSFHHLWCLHDNRYGKEIRLYLS